MSGGTTDIKVGFTCNNDCIHCVIRTNKEALIKNNQSIDTKYAELIDLINNEEVANSSSLVVTGGEPTMRKDFKRLIRYIHKRHPHIKIALQTNGRELYKYLDEFHEKGINIEYIIAIHGEETVHNAITNVSKGNPYQETMKSIDRIIELYPENYGNLRIEVVLSRENIEYINPLIQKLHEKGIHHIGISYPHLDGMYCQNEEETKKVGFPYSKMKAVMPEMIEYAKKKEKLLLGLEKVPRCMYRKHDDTIAEQPPNIQRMEMNMEQQTNVIYPGEEMINFNTTYLDMHRYAKACDKCVMKKERKCFGVWEETIEMFGEEGFTPISKEEYDKVISKEEVIRCS